MQEDFKLDRDILHSDLNGFYASVECFENPELRDKPVAVCGDAELRHGIVLSKNEAAKKFMIKTGDVIWEAKRKCPGLITISADFNKYLRYSAMVKDLYNDYTDQVESFGIDEAWLDVTGQNGADTAEAIKEAC
jgi:DNA polymerase-4